MRIFKYGKLFELFYPNRTWSKSSDEKVIYLTFDDGPIPEVQRWPYDYSKPGAPDDFIPQNVPYSATPESNLPEEEELVAKEKEINSIKYDTSLHD